MCNQKNVLTCSRNRVTTNSKTLFITASNFWTDGSSNRHNEGQIYVDGKQYWLSGTVLITCRTHVHAHFIHKVHYTTVSPFVFLRGICSQAGISKVLLCQAPNISHIWALFSIAVKREDRGICWKYSSNLKLCLCWQISDRWSFCSQHLFAQEKRLQC